DTPRKLAVVLPQIENMFFRQMIMGIEGEAYDHGYVPVLHHTDDQPGREAMLLDMLSREQYAGFLLIPSDNSLITEDILKGLRRPYVIAERPLPCEGEYDFFSMDNFDAGYKATKALIRAGHKHIGLIAWQTKALSLLDRRLGYARALEEANILYRPEYVRSCIHSTEQDGYAETGELLSSQPQLTALVFGYHVPGLGGVRCLRDRGVRIPQDLSVTIVGNPTWVDMTTPAFTHVTLPSHHIGREATHALIERIEHPSPGGARQRVVLKGDLIAGGSVAKLP
ncbi:MAG: substrate-binding domain-containing protein, partial [Eubacteriales bacterium]|nr:substrate-binding domain-containing protein [Eubacteriales bacterium]